MEQDETAQAVIGIINQVIPPILAEQTHRARLEAATRITAAILSNPGINPLNDKNLEMTATYAVAVVEVIEKRLTMPAAQGGEQ